MSRKVEMENETVNEGTSAEETEEVGSTESAVALPILCDEVEGVRTFKLTRRHRIVGFLVLLSCLLIYVPGAGSFGLWDPWETHYGEVSRNMVETNDWVSPWWGFREKIGSEAIAGRAFFSKPVFLFWIEAVSIKTLGLSEWAIRLPVVLIAITALMVLFFVLSRLFSLSAAVLGVLVVGTSPQFFFLSRQAQTDMPFAALMGMGLCLFLLACCGPREVMSHRRFLGRMGLVVGLLLVATVPQYAVIATDLYSECGDGFCEGDESCATCPTDCSPCQEGVNPPAAGTWAHWKSKIQFNGIYHVAGYGLLLLLILLSIAIPLYNGWRRGWDDAFKDRWIRRSYLWLAYALFAFATLSKGLLGFLLPGAIIFVFLLLTVNWKILLRADLIRGFVLFVCVGVPWYMAMFAKHGMAYFNRFFIHDHFQRFDTGVHMIDSGTFEHFIKWLGYGMFPWVVFVPFVLLAFARFRIRKGDPINMAKLFLLVWFLFSYFLFTISTTKFHHYIFPALMPLAVLVALYLPDLFRQRERMLRLVVLVTIGILAAITWDLVQEPQQLRNLFTYKYDRPMPDHMPVDVNAPVAAESLTLWGDSNFYEHMNAPMLNMMNSSFLQFETAMKIIGGLALLGLLMLLFHRVRRYAVWVMGGTAVLMTLYSLNVYMPVFSVHWSQKYVFEEYYEQCTMMDLGEEMEEAYTPALASFGLGGLTKSMGMDPKRVCEEDVISWLITWRGETYYGNNEILPINKEATQFEDYLREYNRGRTFYIFLERKSAASWPKKLNGTYLKKLKNDENFKNIKRFDVETAHDENRYFVLLKATPIFKKTTLSTGAGRSDHTL